jgi:hypothetical protein
MSIRPLRCSLSVILFSLALTVAFAPAARSEDRMLSHDVYFTLTDDSQAKCDELVAGCKEFLTGHPGAVFFGAGVRVTALDRPVNDDEFDVALHVVFEDKAAHDKYQEAERHHEFIEKFKSNWKKVRVFDAWVEGADK